MSYIFGQVECKVDSKGRFLFPAVLLRQLPEEQRQEFVINVGLDNCLTIFPLPVWEAELRKIYAKNQYVEKNRAFARKFQSGAMPVSLDANNRLLIPKRLMDQAAIGADVVLLGAYDRIELWGREQFEAANARWSLEELSAEVMGNEADNA